MPFALTSRGVVPLQFPAGPVKWSALYHPSYEHVIAEGRLGDQVYADTNPRRIIAILDGGMRVQEEDDGWLGYEWDKNIFRLMRVKRIGCRYEFLRARRVPAVIEYEANGFIHYYQHFDRANRDFPPITFELPGARFIDITPEEYHVLLYEGRLCMHTSKQATITALMVARELFMAHRAVAYIYIMTPNGDEVKDVQGSFPYYLIRDTHYGTLLYRMVKSTAGIYYLRACEVADGAAPSMEWRVFEGGIVFDPVRGVRYELPT